MASHYQGSSAEVTALNVFISLFRAADTIDRLLQQQLKGDNLTGPQFGVLETLYHLGPMEQHLLAEKLLVSRGNITFIVDNLEQMRLIVRSVGSKDRRCNQVILTDAGREKIAAIFPQKAAFIAGIMAVLDQGEQEQLASLLKKLGKQIHKSE